MKKILIPHHQKLQISTSFTRDNSLTYLDLNISMNSEELRRQVTQAIRNHALNRVEQKNHPCKQAFKLNFVVVFLIG